MYHSGQKLKNSAIINAIINALVAQICTIKVILICEHALKHNCEWFCGLFWIFQGFWLVDKTEHTPQKLDNSHEVSCTG